MSNAFESINSQTFKSGPAVERVSDEPMTDLALRGATYTLVADPFLNAASDCVVYEPDGCILIREGIIGEIGAYADLRGKLPDDIELRHYPDAILMPGFVDSHIHYPQVEIIGSYGRPALGMAKQIHFPG